jgi:CHAT domain-containing protein/Tfp pilus assembly protein PilF
VIERELSTGDVHSYQIKLQSSQYLRLVIDQWGINMVVAVYRPGGQVCIEFASRGNGTVPISLIANSSGTYRVELRAFEKDLTRGRYKLRTEEVRLAKSGDKSRIAAEKAFAQGEELKAEWRAEASRIAINKYNESLRYWKVAGERREAGNTLRTIGEVYHALGEPQKALTYFKQALQVSQELNDRRGEGETLNDIGSVYIQLGENDKALDYCTKALTLSQITRNRQAEAQALNNIGDAYAAFGNMMKSLEFYNQALPLWQELSDRRGLAQTLMNIGYDHSDLSDEEQGLYYLNKALVLWRSADERRGQALSLMALGHIYSKLGEKQKALDLFSQARELFQSMGDQASEASMLNGMGQVYRHMDEKQKALEYYQQALRLYQALGFRTGEGNSLIQIGRVHYSLGDNEKALHSYQRALTLFQALADPRLGSVPLGEIGRVYESLGDKNKALEYYNQALSLKQAAGDRQEQAYTLNNIGRIHHGLGEKQKALDYYAKSLSLNQAAADRIGESLTLYNIACLERDRGNFIEARAQLEASLRIVESLRTKAPSQDLRTSYFASVRPYFELDIDLLTRLHKQQPNDGFDAAALQASERARARSLLESLAEARAGIRQGVEPALLERERSLQQSLTAKTERQMRLLSVTPKKEEADAVATEIRDLSTEYDQVQSEIRSKSPRYAALTQPQPLGLAEIQQQILDDQTLLLEYSLGDERSYLWAVTPATITSHELPNRADIEKPARRVYELLTARQPQPGDTPGKLQARVAEADTQYWQQAASLSQILLGPVAGQLGSKRLLVVAEGALQYLPFGALPVPGNETGPPVPLIAEHEIVNLPSASVLAVLRRENRQRNAAIKSVAVLADPVFETDDPRLLPGLSSTTPRASSNTRIAAARRRPAPTSDVHRALRDVGILRNGAGIPRLPSSRIEADAILAITPDGTGMKATGFQANRVTATSLELGQYRIVHFATHGLFNSEHPELSGIVLSLIDEQGKPQDGFLRLHDIYNLNLPVDLVVLSACNTGLGKEVKGEGLVGIVRGFMYAGAARVVASLWKVDDEATAELMKRFYQQILREGQSPAAALRAAQTAMWQHKRWRSPYYWAAFGLQGEWKGWVVNPN